MVKLILMRHAQADHGSPDRARKLTEKGTDQAYQRGLDIARMMPTIDDVFVSSAQRTQETAQGVEQSVSFTRRSDLDELYDGGVAAYRQAWSSATGDTCLVIGHEPVVSGSATSLLKNDPRVHEVRGGVSPSTCVIIELESWDADSGRVTDIIRG